MTMTCHVERYVALKRHLGFRFVRQGRILGTYAKHADDHGDEIILCSRMIEAATRGGILQTVRQRLAILRNFALWLHSEDERHEVLPRNVLGRQETRRRTPCLMTPEEIRKVMDAALDLRPAGSITPYSFHFMIGLAAATGMRASEVASLTISDLTPDGVVIRETKFKKTRLVPLHVTVRRSLERYLEIRKQNGAAHDRLFILSNGNPVRPMLFSQKFTELATKAGIKEGPGEGPSLHSLRHTFAVRSLETADATDRASISRHMAALTTYLGHAHVASTYWYLEATPTLLQSISDAVEDAHVKGVSQ